MKNRKWMFVGICAGAVCLIGTAVFLDGIMRPASRARPTSLAVNASGSGGGAIAPEAPARETAGKSELPGAQVDAEFQEFASKVNLGILSSDMAVDEGLWKVKYGDPRRFALLEWHDGVPYKLVRHMFSEESVATFCDLLDDPAYAPHWPRIARIIAFVSKKTDSAGKILQYVERRDDWTKLTPRECDRRISEKAGSLRMIGLFGTDGTTDILRRALTREGARALAKQWSDAIPESFGNDRAMCMLQGSAAMGLVYTQRAENLDIVRKAYEDEHALCERQQASTKLHGQLVDAMAFQDVISEIGMDGFWRLYGTNELIQKTLLATRKYMYKAPR